MGPKTNWKSKISSWPCLEEKLGIPNFVIVASQLLWGAGREPAAATAAGGTVAAGQAAGSIHSRRKVMIKFILADKKNSSRPQVQRDRHIAHERQGRGEYNIPRGEVNLVRLFVSEIRIRYSSITKTLIDRLYIQSLCRCT